MLSFIVPAHDEELLLGRTLASIHAGGKSIGEPYEIIVVDDSSGDRTASIAAEHGARVERVEHRQISRARNAGAACPTRRSAAERGRKSPVDARGGLLQPLTARRTPRPVPERPMTSHERPLVARSRLRMAVADGR